MNFNLTGHCLDADLSFERVDGRFHRYFGGLKELKGRALGYWPEHREGANPFETDILAINLQSTGVNDTGLPTQDAQVSSRLDELCSALRRGLAQQRGGGKCQTEKQCESFHGVASSCRKNGLTVGGGMKQLNFFGSFGGGYCDFEASMRSLISAASFSASATCSADICLLSVSLIRPASRPVRPQWAVARFSQA